MPSITWASPRYVQELATILGPQNHTQGSCDAYYCTSIFTRCLDVFKILCLLHLFKFSSLNRENVMNNDLHQCQNCSTLVIIVSPCEDRRRHLDSRTTAQFESKVMFDARVAAASSTRAEVGRRGHSL